MITEVNLRLKNREECIKLYKFLTVEQYHCIDYSILHDIVRGDTDFDSYVNDALHLNVEKRCYIGFDGCPYNKEDTITLDQFFLLSSRVTI
jgi:hypothetical protein